MSIAADLASLAPSAKLELFDLDLSAQGGSTVRLCNVLSAVRQPVVWRGQVYQHLPIEFSGAEVRGTGAWPRPRLRVGNVGGLVGVLVRQYGKLKGCKLTRRRTLVRFLDAANFPAGNPTADPDAALPDEMWLFDRLASQTAAVVEWELASPLALDRVRLPRHIVQPVLCMAGYRTAECGYAGPPVARADDTPTTAAEEDDCSLRPSGCKLRFGAAAELPIDIQPAVGLVSQSGV